ncbi:MAG: MarR family transcriptional regulator [Sphingosinicella sp.]|nr:MarR family transcriptional regulator [Sphingosinicella sp.]
MAEDLIKELGYLCLGSRFKRLGEQLQAGVEQSPLFGAPVPPGLFPLLAALDRHDTLSITALARILGVTQPGVTRSVGRLVAAGLVEISRTDRDQRQKMVGLTTAGRDLVDTSKRELWPRIEAAVRELCEGLNGNLLGQLAALEDELARNPLNRRIAEANG